MNHSFRLPFIVCKSGSDQLMVLIQHDKITKVVRREILGNPTQVNRTFVFTADGQHQVVNETVEEIQELWRDAAVAWDSSVNPDPVAVKPTSLPGPASPTGHAPDMSRTLKPRARKPISLSKDEDFDWE